MTDPVDRASAAPALEDRPSGERVRAKHLGRALVAPSPPPDLVPARMINEALYCERLLYLEWAQGEFADNYFTVDGRHAHRRADEPGGALPPPPAEGAEVVAPRAARAGPEDRDDDEPPPEPPPYQARSVWLSSERLGITAKIDVVDGEASGRVVPIEYKRGAPADVPERVHLPERAQLCAQVLLLREHGYVCDEGAVYFAKARQRVRVAIDERLIETTLAAAARAKALTARAELPPPLVDSPKCDGCSLAGICLPDEVNLLQRLEGREIAPEVEPEGPSALVQTLAPELEGPLAVDPWGLVGGAPGEGFELRRLQPARDDELPLYVQEQGARVSLSGERLVVFGRKGSREEVRLPNTSQVCLLGNVQLTTQALRAILERGIPLSLFSGGGWYYGRASGLESKNIELRMAQHRAAADPEVCLGLSRGFVVSKIKNSRTILRRNHDHAEPVVLSELDQLARKAAGAGSLGELLGLEGTAARVYFGAFTGMLKGEAARAGDFDLDGRNRRPPRDPINALLSFAYALLTKDFAVAIGAVGLEPLLGFYHQPRFGRPALALDLMEEFRPLVADSVVIGAINTGVVGPDDFVRSPAGVALVPAARKRMLLAHERRMDQLVSHPVFGYRISYRRVLEVQARLLGRLLLGEIARYPAFRTR